MVECQMWNYDTGTLFMRVKENGHVIRIHQHNKPGMSIYTVFGELDGKPCHWTEEGMYRMDGKPDPRDAFPVKATPEMRKLWDNTQNKPPCP